MADAAAVTVAKPSMGRQFVDGLQRIVRVVAIGALVGASLLTFPAAIPWMVAVWLAWHTWLVVRGRPGWAPLAACLAILAVKGVPWLPGMLAFVAILGLVGALAVWHAVRGLLGILALWLAWIGLAYDWHTAAHASRAVALQADRPIVLLGDSLTAGVSPDGGYAPCLRRLVSLPVVDLSHEGITTTDALKDLPALIAAHPQVLVIELGGNDFVRGRSRAETAANLEKIVLAAQQAGADVVLVEIPRGFICDPYRGLERELARRYDLELVSDTVIRELVLWSPDGPLGKLTGGPYLSDDGLHPNTAGNERLAQAVAAALMP